MIRVSLRRFCIASLLTASSWAVDSIPIVNPSFEANNPGGVGYGTPDGWTGTGGVGVNNGGQPFADNGSIPDRGQIGFIQGVGSLSQLLSGLEVGELYWFQGFVNARNCCGDVPDAFLSFDGLTLAGPTTVPPVLGPNPYYFVNAPFIPANSSGLLSISSSAHNGNDATLLIDGLVLIKRSTADIVIANPSFEASGLNFSFPGYVSGGGVGPDIAGWMKAGTGQVAINGTAANTSGNPFADNGLVPDGDNVLAIQNELTLSQTLNDLTIGQPYRLTLSYNSRSGDDPLALITIDGNTAYNATVPEVGGANAYYELTYDFIATATTTTLTIANLGAVPDSTLLVDNVRVFSVPEPSAFAILGLGALLLAWRKRRA